ncbi:MAG: PilZ domain-containing protein [Proteobacteria bacterium]|nr:PilZ domain-containing protein [Pseudomonadota bacterium]MBU1585020.1 PilZ domain-containing protein [Pseudomonadota bacterium]MBU2455606.1 PilZ domain-containing protein [Pseudomonadota bacterium]MBU2630115.1 PilZ domain-containing protein [Pseudomonadota bacterium]
MTQKAFVTKSGKANFSCPECGKVRQMDVSQFNNVKKEVKLKCTCSCKYVFSITLERRIHIRKKVDLKGNILLGKKKYPVTIVDISRFGLKIRANGILDLKIEDKVVIEFTLDDAQESTVSKDVIIKTIKQTDIGVAFSSLDHYDKLGTYLLFHFS